MIRCVAFKQWMVYWGRICDKLLNSAHAHCGATTIPVPEVSMDKHESLIVEPFNMLKEGAILADAL